MPELPEVETVMRGLSRLTGHVILRAEVHRPDMRWPFPAGLAAALAGARVKNFRRRAKYILMRLSTEQSVLWHLGMSGRIVIGPDTGGPPGAHEHVVLHIDDGIRVALCDPRRFGSVDLVPTAAEDAHRLLAGLGPEPLDAAFDAGHLAQALRARRTPIKAALLDQRTVAGLGNIYVSEALFRARVSPFRLAGTLSAARVKILAAAIKQTLADAIAAGGSSVRDYVQPSGELGYFQHAWRVYGHAGDPCERCEGPPCPGILRTVQSGRSTFHCPRTQR